MGVLEFSNNGFIDSLTHAPAPAVFLSSLSREHAGASRDSRTLSILSIRPTNSSTLTELQLISMARTIVSHLRSGEFFSRISEDGYWIAVRGDKSSASKLSERILGQSLKGKWRTSIIECAPPISIDEWIALSDCAHFSTS